MSEQINVEHAFDPEARQAQADMDAYATTRPYEDEKGKGHNPDNNQFINPDTYFDAQREAHEAETMPADYEKMSLTEAAKALAKAEFEGDKTKVEDLNDLLGEKLSAEEDKTHSSRDVEHSSERSDNLFNRVMGVKDKELERLKGDAEGSKVSSSDTTDADESKRVKENGVTDRQAEIAKEINEAVNRRAGRRSGRIEHDDQEDLDDFQAIVDKLKEAYGTDDLSDPRIQKAIEAIDKETLDKINRQMEKDSKVKGGLRPVREGEFDEGKENPPAGVMAIEPWTIDDYGKVDKKPPVVVEPPEEEPPVNPPTIEQPPVVFGPTKPERTKPEKVGRARKFGRACLALLALAPIGYAAGRAHENYIIKSHDVPELDANNKFADNIRDESKEVQTNIANNWGTAQEFFGEHGITTKEGKANFKAMEDAVKEETAKIKAKHGDGITTKRAKVVAEARVKARLAALEAAEVEKAATSK